MTHPRVFSHIGLSVPDLDRAVKFYNEVFGFTVLMAPTEIVEETESAIGLISSDIFSAGYGGFRIAHMATADGIGIELFEFRNAERPANNLEYWKSGIFHFCIEDPDLEGLLAKVEAHGGKARMAVRYYYPGEKPYRMVYVEDPFGIVFEIYSHSYELTYAAGAYQHAPE